jgi:hypothetical protein
VEIKTLLEGARETVIRRLTRHGACSTIRTGLGE